MASVSGTSSSGSTNTNRIFGLSGSGLDVDTIVENLMKTESTTMNKIKQKMQVMEWRQESYRSITTSLKGFKTDFLDYTKSANNMLSSNTFASFTGTSTDATIATAAGSSTASAGTHTIKVTALATAATVQSAAGVTAAIKGSSAVNYASLAGRDFNITVDGTKRNIALDASVTDLASLQKAIDNAVGSNKVVVAEDAGTGALSFSAKSGSGTNKITLSAGTSDALATLGFSSTDNMTNRISTSSSLSAIKSQLANSSAFQFDASGYVNVTINGTTMKFSSSTTLSTMMSTINSNSSAGATMKYDEINDVFKISASSTGAGNSLKISESGSSFFAAMGLSGAKGTAAATSALQDYSSSNKSIGVVIDGVKKDIVLNGNYSVPAQYATNADAYTQLAADIKSGIETAFSGKTVDVAFDANGVMSIGMAAGSTSTIQLSTPSTGTSALTDLGISSGYSAGTDATAIVDGQTLTRGSNTFAVDGVNYTLNKVSDTTVTVGLTQNVDDVYNKIKAFVDKYNETIASLGTLVNEKYNRDYQPLTDDQKADMSEDEITKWEKQAKTGLMHNDSKVQKILTDMRRALNETVKDVGLSLSDIGITTGTYSEGGKLSIDDSKLKAAIKNDPATVSELFSKKSTSTTTYLNLTSEQGAVRYQEEGLAYRISDIIDKNIRTTRDVNGNKGYLIDIAGVEGDVTQYTSSFSKQISDYEDDISRWEDKLEDKRTALYKKYSALETALSKLNSQSSYVTSMLSSGSN